MWLLHILILFRENLWFFPQLTVLPIKILKITNMHIPTFVKKYLNMLLEPVIGYTRVVFATKFLLSAIAIILVLMLIALPLVNDVKENFRISFTSVENAVNTEEPKMINPRFQGVDKDNQTYNIMAENAIKKKDDTLVLSNINANINLKDNSLIEIKSETGSFNHEKKFLELAGNVNMVSSNGYELSTESIFVNLEDKSAYGESEIHAKMAFGSLKADNFKVTENGNRILFTGNVHLVFDQEAYEKNKAESGI
jgi:lipopolysaccharide export system protein LptC